MNDPQFSENIPGAQPEAEHGTKRKALGTTIVITGFGRQKVYPPVGRVSIASPRTAISAMNTSSHKLWAAISFCSEPVVPLAKKSLAQRLNTD